MVKNISKSVDWVVSKLGVVSGLLILLVGLVIIYEVIVRSLGHPTIWASEISNILFLWGSLLGVGYTSMEKAHVKVDVITANISARMSKLGEFCVVALGTLYCVVVFWQSSSMAVDSFLRGERIPSLLGTPMWISQAAIPVGIMFLFLTMIRGIVNQGKNGNGGSKRGGISVADIMFTLLMILILGIIISVSTFEYGKNVIFLHLVVLLLALLLVGMPVFLTLGLVGSYGLFTILGAHSGLSQVSIIFWSSLDSFTLIAVPLFLMTGHLFMASGLSHDLFNMARAFVRHLPGGLGIAAIFASAIFAAITGSSAATAATIGMIAIPEMRKSGYSNELTLGTLAAGGTLGILIPPSIPLIIYGMLTGESVADLFIAGIVPGIIISFLFALYLVAIHKFSKKYSTTLEKPAFWGERLRSVKDAIWGIMGPVIILGGIYTGIFTPTEAAGVGLGYGIVIWFIIYRREVNWKTFNEIILNTAKTNSMIMVIVAGALIFGQVITFLQIPSLLNNLIVELTSEGIINKYLVLALVSLLMLFLGCFLEIISVMLIVIPIIFPIIVELGFDPIWFGILVTINMELAAITPPVGINLYIIMGVSDSSLVSVVKGVIPYVVILIASIVFFTIQPQLVTCLLSF